MLQFFTSKDLLLVLCLANLGCASATIGKRFDVPKAKELRVCEMSRQNVRAALGDPYQEGIQNGFESDIYSFVHSFASVLGGRGSSGSFVAFYDKNGKLIDLALNPLGSFFPTNRCISGKND